MMSRRKFHTTFPFLPCYLVRLRDSLRKKNPKDISLPLSQFPMLFLSMMLTENFNNCTGYRVQKADQKH